MKILFVAPFYRSHYLWLKALRQLHCQIKIFKLTEFPGNRIINYFRLKSVINNFQPDEIFFSAGLDAVLPFKNTVFFTGVAPETLSASERRIGIKAKLVVVNDPTHIPVWQRLGAKKTICLPISAIDPADFPARKLKKIYPVSFVGTLFPYRQRQLLAIAKLYPGLKIWGRLEPGIKLSPALKPNYQGLAEGTQLIKIYQQSLIGLNLAPAHLPSAGNLRAFEIPAAGALLLSDHLNSDWYVNGREAVLFTSPQDCVAKINYYLSHPDKLALISRRARIRTLRRHTYYRRFKQLIKFLS
ncbi:MAG: glycosyltransferase [Patescibacteria group bacterium]